ncbi:DUF1634 domain-containing protein [Acidicapsa dinghuensis]|uniref:DUF1634 domain-containing protein n=1 Tax=Acidicapsa dinghuensis TaxID=2218256 RepID=A0ABW1EF05_9BACT|nr:DUF1634 domain-containing protein [Acidicapsa dinghuensis]
MADTQTPVSNAPQGTDDSVLDAKIGMLLQVGVLSSAVVVLIGALLYLSQQGNRPVDYSSFHGAPNGLNTFGGIFRGAIHFHPLAIIQLGLLMLIATPIARVVFSVIAFLAERDYLYVVISAIVLAVLCYSLAGH